MTHHNLAFKVSGRLKRDADHDQQRGTAERECLKYSISCHRKHDREHGDKTEKERADESDTIENLLDVVCRSGLPGR